MNLKRISFSIIAFMVLANQLTTQAVSFAGVKNSVNTGVQIVKQKTKDTVDWVRDNKKKTIVTAVIMTGLFLYSLKLRNTNKNKRQEISEIPSLKKEQRRLNRCIQSVDKDLTILNEFVESRNNVKDDFSVCIQRFQSCVNALKDDKMLFGEDFNEKVCEIDSLFNKKIKQEIAIIVEKMCGNEEVV